MVWPIFKKLDMFKVPVEMYITQIDKRTGKREHNTTVGSLTGTLLTFFVCFLGFGYLTQLILKMASGQLDVLTSNEVPNNYGEHRIFNFTKKSYHSEFSFGIKKFDKTFDNFDFDIYNKDEPKEVNGFINVNMDKLR